MKTRMDHTIECRGCGHTTRSHLRTCPACGVRRPGRNLGFTFTLSSLVVFVVISGGSLWLYFNERSAQLVINLVIAATAAAIFRLILPMIVGSPRIRRGSLVYRIKAVETRVGAITGQLESLADAFGLARARAKSRLIDSAMSRLKKTYTVLKRYRDRFEAQLVMLQFSLWTHETAAIVAGWERSDSAELSQVYNRLIQRTDSCRVAFQELVTGKKRSGVFAEASASVRVGLAQAETVADAMVARKAQLALSAVSPASIPPEPFDAPVVEDLATEDCLRATDDLEREFDRIMAEHELS